MSINRRQFISLTSAGLATAMMPGGVWAVETRGLFKKKSYDFRPYRKGQTMVPVTCVTPDDGFYMHTFYDVCPWSPDSRYMAVIKFPYQRRKPEWDTTADVCLIDLQEQTIETIYRTKAWSYQLGASIQWDRINSHFVYCNDIIDGKPVCVRINLRTRQAKAFSGSVYSVSPDGSYVISPNLMTMNSHQYGYAVPDLPHGKPGRFKPEDMAGEGLWRTDLETNETKLLVPFSEFAQNVTDTEFYDGGVFYLFHSKINLQNDKIMQVVRYHKGDNTTARNPSLFTMDTDGSNLVQCFTREQWSHKGDNSNAGNHPNWHPDGRHIVMNCVPRWIGNNESRICQFKYDGSDFQVLVKDHIGGGHPTMHPGGRYAVTDAYTKETYAVGPDFEIPLRLFDLETRKEHTLLKMPTDVGGGGKPKTELDHKIGGSPHKLDPHPAWNRDYTKMCLNGAPEKRRQVYVADLENVIGYLEDQG
jgi:hypothetical protein